MPHHRVPRLVVLALGQHLVFSDSNVVAWAYARYVTQPDRDKGFTATGELGRTRLSASLGVPATKLACQKKGKSH